MNKLKNVTMKNSGQDPEVSNLMQRLVREGTLIAYSLLALFLLIALVSYSPTDPGFTTTGTGEDVVNAVGVYGAWLADIFWYLLGYLAFAFPVLLIYKVYTSFRETALEAEFSWPLFGMKTGGFVLLVISACGLATLHFHIVEELPSAGGVIGSSGGRSQHTCTSNSW